MANINSVFYNCSNLKTINNINKLGNTGAGTAQDATTFLSNSTSYTGITTFTCKLSKLDINGVSSTYMAGTTGLRLSNTNTGQWGGASPQLNVSYTNMSTAALNLLFGDLAAQGSVVSKTINITGASGAAGLTAADRLVLTSIGWTITG